MNKRLELNCELKPVLVSEFKRANMTNNNEITHVYTTFLFAFQRYNIIAGSAACVDIYAFRETNF